MSRLFELDPGQFAAQMIAEEHPRAYLVFDSKTRSLNVSHPMFGEVASWLLKQAPDFRDHEAVFLAVGPQTRSLFAAFIHKTVRGQAQGGLRRWPYQNVLDVLRDGLRLSAGMTRKNALAGLWWGGGKGIIARSPGPADLDPEQRALEYREYGAFISSLRGCYVTAEDVGTHPTDMAELFRTTRFVTCVPPEVGGSGNPSAMTAVGVICAMEAALQFAQLGAIAGKKIAVQGAGHVGSSLIQLLLDRGASEVVVSDVSADRCSAVLDAYSDHPVTVRHEQPGDGAILAEACDVLSPCALGGVLNPKTIPQIRASVVCGSANNQLDNESRDGVALKDRGIVHVPDFVANRMGIVYCGNEQYGYVNGDPMVKRHLGRSWSGGIYQTTRRVLELARNSDVPPVIAARRLADEMAEQPHPIWGHRSAKIIESLVAGRWERS